MQFRVLSWLLISILVWPVGASTLQDGIDFWHSGDRASAVAVWGPLAEQGDAEAGLFLAYAYRNGLGVERSYGLAARWYRYAAERGHPEAQYELALMYELGLGVPQDANEAAAWYGLSSAQTCPAELTAGGRLGDR